MNETLSPYQLMPENPSKDVKNKIQQYIAWTIDQVTEARPFPWLAPDLTVYAHHLLTREPDLDPKKPDWGPLRKESALAHLSVIRSQYRRILQDRDFFYQTFVPDNVTGEANRKAVVDEAIARWHIALSRESVKLKGKVVQDKADSQQIRLTRPQAEALMNSPDLDTLRGLRDLAMLAMFLCTGIREGELVQIEVSYLREKLEGELSLLVPEGKGQKQRMVPYGQLSWVLPVTERWLASVGIAAGPVFRGFTSKNCDRVRDKGLTTRMVQNIVSNYPLVIDGTLVNVKPHDLRRTYARLLWESGVDLISIQNNLGHKNSGTTLDYIGEMDAGSRRPGALYRFDLSKIGLI